MLETLYSIGTSIGLVFLAEIGDKSQLVCMTLAARYRHWPVFLGASAAFVVLNTLAVVFGASVAHWIPENIVAGVVAVMFLIFGIKSLNTKDEEDYEEVAAKLAHSIFISTFMMLFIAEMGDKTQIAVAGLSSTLDPIAVLIGANLALLTTSAIGVWLGIKCLKLMPLHRMHQLSGIFFIVIAAFALTSLV